MCNLHSSLSNVHDLMNDSLCGSKETSVSTRVCVCVMNCVLKILDGYFYSTANIVLRWMSYSKSNRFMNHT